MFKSIQVYEQNIAMKTVTYLEVYPVRGKEAPGKTDLKLGKESSIFVFLISSLLRFNSDV